MIHSILFNKNNDTWHYSKDRLNFIKHLNVKPLKRVKIEGNYYRYRINESIKNKSYYSKKLPNDIIIVFQD